MSRAPLFLIFWIHPCCRFSCTWRSHSLCHQQRQRATQELFGVECDDWGALQPQGQLLSRSEYWLSRQPDKCQWLYSAVTSHFFPHKGNSNPRWWMLNVIIKNHHGGSWSLLQIWANIQPYEQPSQVNFDLSNSSLWKPFFTKSNPHPGFPSVQVSSRIPPAMYKEPPL